MAYVDIRICVVTPDVRFGNDIYESRAPLDTAAGTVVIEPSPSRGPASSHQPEKAEPWERSLVLDPTHREFTRSVAYQLVNGVVINPWREVWSGGGGGLCHRMRTITS